MAEEVIQPNRAMGAPALRVAILAGTLGKGGAEKQLVYIVRSLIEAGVDIRVCTLTRGEFYEPSLLDLGVLPQFVGQSSNALIRLAAFGKVVRSFRPHVLQSAHFYANLYVGIVGRLFGIPSIGAVRNDFVTEVNANGVWGRWLARVPTALVANSTAAQRNAAALGFPEGKISHLPNVIDVQEFDRKAAHLRSSYTPGGEVTAMIVCRLVAAKRVDRFLRALEIAVRTVPGLVGVVVGDGAERSRLEDQARDRGLLGTHVFFLGERDDVPALLTRGDFLVVSSDHEGFPNVVLEAMAARLPVITTPAGDAAAVVDHTLTGYVVPFDDIQLCAEKMIMLAQSPAIRHQLGTSGRTRAEQSFALEGLGGRLLGLYEAVARKENNRGLLNALMSFQARNA